MAFELVEREYTVSNISGTYYGPKPVVVARDPDQMLIWGSGLHIITNRHAASLSRNHIRLGFNLGSRLSKEMINKVAGRIEEHFGPESVEAIQEAVRTRKTVLFDGGGEPPVEHPDVTAARHAAARANVSINWRQDLSGRVCGCKQCAKPLEPKLVVHTFGEEVTPDQPRSLEDCQRLTNFEVVEVMDYGDTEGPRVGYVHCFYTWDGESVFDPFCGNTCAAKYGRRAAEVLNLEPKVEPVRVQWTYDGVVHKDGMIVGEED